MRKLFLTAVASLLLAIAEGVPAQAQIIDRLDADIPFAFTVADKTLPAGRYSIMPVNQPFEDVMKIRSVDGNETVLFLIDSTQLNTAPGTGELVFHKAGDRYFLSQIFEQGDKIGAELPRSRVERRLDEEAMMISRNDSVVIALQRAAAR